MTVLDQLKRASNQMHRGGTRTNCYGAVVCMEC